MKQVTLQQRLRTSMVALAAVILGGCSLFGSDDGPVVKELLDFTPSATPKVLWEASVGSGIDGHFSRLNPTVSGDLVIAADRKGLVRALNRADGKQVWQVDLRSQLNKDTGWFAFGGEDLRISGGLTSSAKHVLLGTERGLVMALNVADGSIAWSANVRGEVLSDPAVGEGKVVVKTAAGDLIAFNEDSGEQL
jgi:outer membrane protein assembly factor BamB